MENFLLDNAQRHQGLVKRFVPPPAKQNAGHKPEPPARDLIIATRIRPILEDEASSGHAPCCIYSEDRYGRCGSPRVEEGRSGVADVEFIMLSTWNGPLLPWVWDGNVGTLFAYGQTGSGKTFSISRLERLVARNLFDGSLYGERKVYVSIFELAGNTARDLLLASQSAGAGSAPPIQLLEDSFGDVQLTNAFEPEVTFAGELLQLIEQTAALRKTASTEKNNGSSRSHAVCRLRIVNPSSDVLEDGYLYLIDLAGSEAARDIAEHGADRMKETREINISLSILKDCIRSITDANSSKSSKKPYVPFRQSTLTKTLKHVFDPFGGRKCKTAVLACVNPSFLDTGATKNTLRYAEMLSAVPPTNKSPGYNPNVPMTWTNKDVRHYIVTKSGNPSIAPYELAPRETGAQFLRLPIEDFVQRSLQTPGVTGEQANAFHLKLWTLHLDSQRKQSTKTSNKQGAKSDPQDPLSSSLSSRDPSKKTGILFTDRIRPGMAVLWNPPAYFPYRHEEQNMVVVLCPLHAASENVNDVMGHKVQPFQNLESKFLCALALPGPMGQSYEVHLWRQAVVPVQQMLSEVVLEYDPATRYYYVSA
ncbi:hypothetical protein N7481_007731 [Penicillium waksmanii]|uniref:uncharacterized protein n=1 Tax=Penicillium waksmanii TaxID=69791 RepID=UPI0025465B22|nr:uncharacterized protein N7481_007731 [Penicillium waksmanii]KAJ5980433.1 hypothetical protein N7481_007731 [Penicillium waksmanii]